MSSDLKDTARALIILALAQGHLEESMRKRLSPDERYQRTHWEGLVRTIIDQIGPEQLAEVIEYVTEQMLAENRRLRDFAVETRREH